jgi:thiol-disulfide isomerase/thioredoxin
LVVFGALALTPSFSFADDAYSKPSVPERIAHGQQVALEKYLAPGKTTVFDFTSEYCPPCRAISPRLDKLHAKRDDVVVVKIDINRPGVKGIDWKSPVATQYGMRSIPNFKVYGPDGKLKAEGQKARDLVESWLE